MTRKDLMRKSVRQQIKIIEAIVSAREEAQISRMELSSKLGGSSTLMQKIETGDRDVKVWEFIAIARALDIDPCELMRRAVSK
jgi:ribosome-binding protein aMBF1 (putative translation factor)